MITSYLTKAVHGSDIAYRDEDTEIATLTLGLIALEELECESLCNPLFVVVYREGIEECCLIPER
jgi:hypothetical protein